MSILLDYCMSNQVGSMVHVGAIWPHVKSTSDLSMFCSLSVLVRLLCITGRVGTVHVGAIWPRVKNPQPTYRYFCSIIMYHRWGLHGTCRSYLAPCKNPPPTYLCSCICIFFCWILCGNRKWCPWPCRGLGEVVGNTCRCYLAPCGENPAPLRSLRWGVG